MKTLIILLSLIYMEPDCQMTTCSYIVHYVNYPTCTEPTEGNVYITQEIGIQRAIYCNGDFSWSESGVNCGGILIEYKPYNDCH